MARADSCGEWGGFGGGDGNLYAYVGGDPANFVDPLGLNPRSTLGGDDPAFGNPEEKIRELEEELKKDCLSQKEKEKIKRRIRELRRKPSNTQQHHSEACGVNCQQAIFATGAGLICAFQPELCLPVILMEGAVQ